MGRPESMTQISKIGCVAGDQVNLRLLDEVQIKQKDVDRLPASRAMRSLTFAYLLETCALGGRHHTPPPMASQKHLIPAAKHKVQRFV
jgi:hypothetical protein